MISDTIAAISTPLGEGAIAIVRLSGDEAIAVSDRFFKSPSGKSLSEVSTHTIHYGHLLDPKTETIVEEVMVTVLRAPNTFTKEDVVEINCHGGIVAVNRVLALVLSSGVRLADPGEFTKRAFLNGRIDLSQAEAVMDLIRAKTDKAMGLALGQIDGRLSSLIRELRQKILTVLAQVEVNIDYPEYDDVEEVSQQLLEQHGREIQVEIVRLLQTAEQGKILREGIATAIIGRPNVGKSSLLNGLLRENKAIVTDIPGTTRDIIEEYVNVRGVPLKLIDTAGIRETEDVVERIGVERSHAALEQADLVLLVLNYAEPLQAEDERLLKLIEGKKVILVVNKLDLPEALELDKLPAGCPVIQTSAVNHIGIEDLEQAISSLFFQGEVVDTAEATYVSNARHIALLEQALAAIKEALAANEEGMPIDVVQIDMTRAWELLGEIIGENVHDSLIDQLFSQFCLGK